MKNRRNIVIAFLLCACLLVGIGYAQISGQLIIGGNARFNGQSELTNEVKAAVVFSDAKANDSNCISATFTDKNATVDIVINDAKGTADEFSSSATFTIKYNTEEAYPDVIFSDLAPAITSASGITGWTITTVYENAQNGATTNGTTATLVPGSTVDVTVTVKFNNNASGEIYKNMDNATISVPLNYVTAAE